MTDRSGRHTHERLKDILAAVARTKQAERQMVAAEVARDEVGISVAFDAVLYNLVVIGEAVNALPPELIATRPEIPWRDVVDMRNFLSHEYFRVLADVVRQTIDEPLDQLHQACEQLLDGRPR
jgi:uncharacterized protein with HEPN domain